RFPVSHLPSDPPETFLSLEEIRIQELGLSPRPYSRRYCVKFSDVARPRIVTLPYRPEFAAGLSMRAGSSEPAEAVVVAPSIPETPFAAAHAYTPLHPFTSSSGRTRRTLSFTNCDGVFEAAMRPVRVSTATFFHQVS